MAGAIAVCPKCKEPLVVVEFQGVELDYCVDCRGSWFDAGELELIVELAGARADRMREALAGQRLTGDRRCPRCRRKMNSVRTATNPQVAVDVCPRGEGVWLDAGELATLTGALSGGAPAGLAEFLGDLFRHELGQTQQ